MDTVFVGGVNRPFDLSQDVLDALEHVYGITPVNGSLFRISNSTRIMRDVVFLALYECDKSITREQVGSWLTFQNTPKVLSTILESLVTPQRRQAKKPLSNKDLNKSVSVSDYAVRIAYEHVKLTAQDVLLYLGASQPNVISIAVNEYGVDAVVSVQREFTKALQVKRLIHSLHKQGRLHRFREHMCNAADIPLIDLARASVIFINLAQPGVDVLEDLLKKRTQPFTRIAMVNAAFRSQEPVATVSAEAIGGLKSIIRTYTVNMRPRSSQVPYNASPAAEDPIPASEPEQSRPDPVAQPREPVYKGNPSIPNQTIFGEDGSLLMTDPPEAGKE